MKKVKKAKSIRAWAAVDKKDLRINVNDIFRDKDICLHLSEKLIRVKIEEI